MMPSRSTSNDSQQQGVQQHRDTLLNLQQHHNRKSENSFTHYHHHHHQQQEQQQRVVLNYATIGNSQTNGNESPPPAPPVRDSSTLKSVKYGPGHEKFPSWPVPVAAETPQGQRNPAGGGSHRSKSWTDHTNYPKEKVIAYSRPYMKKQHSAYTQQKLKTVMEKCEKIPPETYESRYDKMTERVYLPQVDQDGKSFGDSNYVVPSPPERDIATSAASAVQNQLTREDLEQYSRIYNHQEMMNFHLTSERKGSQHLTESELEKFMESNYDDSLFNSMGSKSDESILTHLHQKQLSYAQSEGYHSYVSSTDSTTPFLDRLRKDSHAVVMRPCSWDEGQRREGGRDSVVTTSSGSASSSETLKWLGSISDVSVASSSSCAHLANNHNNNNNNNNSLRQLIAHSARVQIPQRQYHSESVLYISSETSTTTSGVGDDDAADHNRRDQNVFWKDKESRNNNANKLKLFALNTYTVHETERNVSSGSNRSSFQSMPSVAERINELEKQHRYSYLDPEKKHKIPDPTLKAIQKKALLSFYERHHSNSTSKHHNWRSEPQLTPSSSQFAVPQPPPRIIKSSQLPSRRASSASDYASGNNSRRSSLAVKEAKSNNETLGRITPRHQHSNSCGSLSTDLLGPIIVGPSISLDDWVPKGPPERPPKNPQLRTTFPELFQRLPSPDLPPPSPPTVLEDEVFNCDEPLPPPPPECEQDLNDHHKEAVVSRGQFPGPQVKTMKKLESPIEQTVGLPLENSNFLSVGCRSIKTKPTEQIFHQVSSKPYNGIQKSDISMMHFQNQRSSDTKYPITQKLVLNNNSSSSLKYSRIEKESRISGVSQENEERSRMVVAAAGPHVSKQTKDGRNSGNLNRRSSFADSSGDNHPPPLQPRQMRINQSMRVGGSNDRIKPLRWSPSKDPFNSQTRSQSKASVLASRRDRERVVADCDTGSYKRTMSPNGGPHSAELLSESSKINTRETIWPNKIGNTKTTNSNSSTTIFRRVSMDDKTSTKVKKGDFKNNINNSSTNLVLPDVLPVNAKLLTNRSHYNSSNNTNNSRPSYLNFSFDESGCEYRKKSPMKTPPQSPSKSPSRVSPLTPLKATNLSSNSCLNNNRISPPILTSARLTTLTVPFKSLESNVDQGSSSLNSQTQSSTISPSSTPPSPVFKQQLSPKAEIKLSSPGSSNTSTPDPEVPIEDCRKVITQRTEVILRVNTTTSDASSQTEKEDGRPPTPSPSRKKLQEEIDCELLSEDLISHLPPNCDRLKEILVPGPTFKKPFDYVQSLFKADVTSKPRSSNSPFRIRSRCTTPNDSQLSTSSVTTIDDSTIEKSSAEKIDSLPCNNIYFPTPEPEINFSTRYDRDETESHISKCTKELNRKKEELAQRLGQKLDVLKGEQLLIDEEFRYNQELGENVESHINKLARPQEAAKFRLHVEEIGKITSLLLGLSGRLARAENALIGIGEDHSERKILEEKRDKLLSQLEEAKSLKQSIDRRSVNVSNFLSKYLDAEEYADYDHFINMKAKLMMDSKEIADKIKLGEEQLIALRESLLA